MYCMYVHTDFNVGNIDNRESQKPENFVGSFDIPFTGDTSSTADFSGINGYFTFRYQFRTSLLPTYAKIQYRDVKYPLIPEKPGIRRGIVKGIDSQEDGCNNCISVLQSPRVPGVEIDNWMQLAR